MAISEIVKPVARSLKLLWSHERGEMCIDLIPAAATIPEFSMVDKQGLLIDVTANDYAPTDVYGIHVAGGQVYWAHSIFNDLYINWPVGITTEQKAAIIEHFKSTFVFIKSGV